MDKTFPDQQLNESIAQCMLVHRFHFSRRVQALKKKFIGGENIDSELVKLIDSIERSVATAFARQNTIPEISLNEALPISEKASEIASAIKRNQVIVLAGETGSGKTTQIPKICLSIGRGIFGRIGHTQPRRIAARTVASRIADELNSPLGDAVGYQVRFNDAINENTLIKLMTDGILLNDIQSDPFLNQYDTIIIDEAHERSLNIDFLLGYLKQLLPKRPDLKLVVTSATIDLQKFSQFFNDAPIFEVSGRTYPVGVFYHPWQDYYEDLNEAIVTSVQNILRGEYGKRGDILIFLSGEREIREVSHNLKKAALPHIDILPLYARLGLHEQNKIFTTGGRLKIVLSTNVAETSVTVPGIKYVIDPGTARVSRYSLRTKVQRLPIEAISQASANQRKGRCGRVSEGVCLRLYSEDDFNSRAEFTDAEILRTNLAAVILQMLNLKIGDVRKFPFIDKPDARMISDGFKLLEEINAVDVRGNVTALGRQLQQIPLDPRLARIVLEAAKWDSLKEILIVVSALSIQDVRERPAEKQQASDEKHRRFWDESSDFIAYINLWQYVENQRQELSQNQLKKLCQREFLNFLRLKEWRELHHQVRNSLGSIGLKENQQAANYERIHRSLLAGLLTNVGKKNIEKGERDYFGTRNRKFMIFPGSSQYKKRPPWCLAAQYIETSQLFAHHVAKIEPSWALDCADHLVKKHFFEPHYDVKSGQVKAFQRITLFGLTLVEKQKVNYQHVKSEEANDIFIRAALVEGMYRGNGKFYRHNHSVIEEIHVLEAKSRRRDLMVDDEVIFNFYRDIIPRDIVNLRGFEHWRKSAERKDANILFLTKDSLLLQTTDHVSQQQFPDSLTLGDIVLPLRYCFEPGKENDGVNLLAPVEVLHAINADVLEWLVPGLLREKCIALVKSLPKNIRKNLVPVPQYVDKVMPRLKVQNKKLTDVLAECLGHITSVKIQQSDWDESHLDNYYRMNIQVIDENGKVIDQHRDIVELRNRYRHEMKQTLEQVGHEIEKENIARWDFGDLESSVQLNKGAVLVKAYPALVDKKSHVDLRLHDNPDDALYFSLFGIARLFLLEAVQQYKYLQKHLLKGKDLGLSVVKMGKRQDVVDRLIVYAVIELMTKNLKSIDQAIIRTEKDFRSKSEYIKSNLVQTAQEYESKLVESLELVVGLKKQIKSCKNVLLIASTIADINNQLMGMFDTPSGGFIPLQWFNHYPRFLKAAMTRLEKAPANPQREKIQTQELEELWQMHQDRLSVQGETAYFMNERWQTFRWMIEELRVSHFAQSLKTSLPVSRKRLDKMWSESESL